MYDKAKNLGRYVQKGTIPYNKGVFKRVSLICSFCSNSFLVTLSRKNRAKYCSFICLGKGNAIKYKENRIKKQCVTCEKEFYVKPSHKEYTHCSSECRNLDVKSFINGKSHYAWKGDQVGYYALHAWVIRHKGKAKICFQCKSVKKIEWANKSHQYKRDLYDWIELCYLCHRKYDTGENWGKASKKYSKLKERGDQYFTK